MRIGILVVFILRFKIILTSENSSECPAAPQCNCTISNNVKIHHCSDFLGNSADVSIQLCDKDLDLTNISINCANSSEFSYTYSNLTKGINIDDKRIRLNIHNCFFPEESFLSKLQSLGIGNVKFLCLNSVHRANILNSAYYNGSKGNEILPLPDEVFQGLHLRYLSISNNELMNITQKLFEPVPKLRILELQENNLVYLPENIFHNLTILNTLDLSKNDLSSIPGSVFQFTVELTMLLLQYNALTSLNDTLFQPLTKLIGLNLEHNKLESINSKVFSTLVSLKLLYLNDNNLKTLEFDALRQLAQLSELNLSRNQLYMNNFTDMNYAPYSTSVIYYNSVLVRLKDNSLTNVPLIFGNSRYENLTLELSYNSIRKLNITNLINLPFSITINLMNNNITEICFTKVSKFDFSSFMKKRINCAYRSAEIKLSNNQILCDCKEDLILGHVKIQPNILGCRYINNSTIITSVDFIYFYNVCFVNSCPSPCICYLGSFKENVIIECNSSYIGQLQENVLQNMNNVTLFLANKNLDSLREFAPLILHSKVTELILSHNKLKTIEDLDLPQFLEVLELHNNELSNLNKNFIDKLNKLSKLRNITLHNNSWQCNCDLQYLWNFLETNYTVIHDIKSIVCIEDKKPINSLSINDLCNQSKLDLTTISLILAAFSITFGISTVLFHRYQYEIKVYLFSRNLCIWWVTENEVDQNKIYDAFISYAHQDENFVVEHLVPQLENRENAFKLCLHFRDWVVGGYIPDQITNSVENSRRTIVILSSNFLNSVWAMLEFRTAYLKALEEHRARIVVILLTDIEVGDLDASLKTYLTTNTYLKWGDPMFWQKLRYTLPHHRNNVPNKKEIQS